MRVEPKVTIQNVVASARFEHRIDLKAVVRAFPDADYRPERFPGLVFRLKKPKSSCLIFETGRMVSTGTRSVREARRAVLTLARELSKNGIVVIGTPELQIQNIVASVDLGNVTIPLDDFIYAAHKLGRTVIYEPDQFPGAIYRMENPQVVFLVFTTGKLVCVGAKREEDVYRATENLQRILQKMHLIIREGENFGSIDRFDGKIDRSS